MTVLRFLLLAGLAGMSIRMFFPTSSGIDLLVWFCFVLANFATNSRRG